MTALTSFKKGGIKKGNMIFMDLLDLIRDGTGP